MNIHKGRLVALRLARSDVIPLQHPHSTETTARPFTQSGTFTARSSCGLSKAVNAK